MKQHTVDHDSSSEHPESRLAKLECFTQFDEVSRRLARTRDLVAGAESHTVEAFRQSFAELQQGLLNAEPDLIVALFEFDRTLEDKHMQKMTNIKGEVIGWHENYISKDEIVTVSSVGNMSTISTRNLTTGKVETKTTYGRLPMPPEK